MHTLKLGFARQLAHPLKKKVFAFLRGCTNYFERLRLRPFLIDAIDEFRGYFLTKNNV